MVIAFGVGQVLWSLLWFSLFFLWLMLVFRIVADIFRSDDMGGVAKALWILLGMVLPFIGSLLYLVSRGDGMARREMAAIRAQDDAARSYIQQAAGSSPSAAEELSKLAKLRDDGVIDAGEFARLKARIVG
jgi:hypothetical protein